MTYTDPMTYTEYKNHLKVCEYTGKPPVDRYREMYNSSTTLWEDMSIVIDPDYLGLTLRKKDFVLFLVNPTIRTWCFDRKLWNTISHLSGVSDSETQVFLKEMMEDHLMTNIESPQLY